MNFHKLPLYVARMQGAAMRLKTIDSIVLFDDYETGRQFAELPSFSGTSIMEIRSRDALLEILDLAEKDGANKALWNPRTTNVRGLESQTFEEIRASVLTRSDVN